MSEANQLCGWLYETIHGADFPLEQWRSRFQDLMSRRPPRRVLGRLLNIAVQSTRLDCVTDLLRAGSGIDTDGGGPAIDVVVGDLYDLRVHGDIERETDRVLGMCRLLIEWGADPWVEVNDAYGFATSSAAQLAEYLGAKGRRIMVLTAEEERLAAERRVLPPLDRFGAANGPPLRVGVGTMRIEAKVFQTLIRRLDARSMEAGEATDPLVLESVINAWADVRDIDLADPRDDVTPATVLSALEALMGPLATRMLFQPRSLAPIIERLALSASRQPDDAGPVPTDQLFDPIPADTRWQWGWMSPGDLRRALRGAAPEFSESAETLFDEPLRNLPFRLHHELGSAAHNNEYVFARILGAPSVG